MKRELARSKIIAVVGQTAVGKSSVAVALARRFNGEVISADSRQVYKGLDIGTGKITTKEMGDIPHHLLDVANPKRRFSVAEYQKLAQEKITDILSRGKVPIIVGGTGLYVDAVLTDVQFPEVPPHEKLRRKLQKKTPAELFSMLTKLDPRRALHIDRYNPRRLIRAIEIAKALGSVPPVRYGISPKFESLSVGLTLSPNVLKKRIEKRLLARIASGMIAEARKLHSRGLSWKQMESLGLEYRYLSRFLRRLITKKDMIRILNREIWHYAKRQLTWFKRNKEIVWFEPTKQSKIQKIIKKVETFLRR